MMKLLNHTTKPVLLMMLFACSAYGNGWMWIKSYPWVYSDFANSWLYIASDGTPSVYNNDTWDTKTSSYFSELGWVWMKDANFGYLHKEEKWIYISNHDENSTFFFDSNSSSWLNWKNFSKLEITHLELSDDDLKPNQSSSNTLDLNLITGSKQDFSLVQDYPRLKSIKYLGHTFSPINNSYLSKLTSLEISFAKKSTSGLMDDIGANEADLSAISDLTNIERLVLKGAYEPTLTLGGEGNLYGGLISDISPLSNLTNLTYLEISGANITDTSPLDNLKNLQTIDISQYEGLDNSEVYYLRN